MRCCRLSRSDLVSTTYPIHWTVSRSTNKLFTGRDDVLCKLEGIIEKTVGNPSRHEPYRIVITGMGGLGKSEICLQLAHLVQSL